ncbi:unnamed protein product [Blepharisma stoltei]|uniref:Myosin motor domain-containing protein n=1 Tax=Blepharisma stoltei TaxID=1481888 RepID=A0AAU9JD78_9CILI|nr:unnamed protein product [Blepharisma stoltei]
MLNSRKRDLLSNTNSFSIQQSRISETSFFSSTAQHSMLQELGLCDNLVYLQEHSENSIYKTISNRYESNMNFTFAGPLLLSVHKENDSSQYEFDKREEYSEASNILSPHLYSISSKAYFHMKEAKQNQVISLLGLSGSGKTFSTIHLIDHLIYISCKQESSLKMPNEFFDLLHSGIQALHIMGSIATKENLESTCCGMVTEIHFDSEFRSIGGSIKAKLLDITLPNSAGRTYNILHALLTNTRQNLQNLGLSNQSSKLLNNNAKANDLNQKIHDGDVLKRFFDNLKSLGIQRKDINNLLEVLAAVVHFYDITFASTGFITAGQKDGTKFLPRHRVAVQKVCRLLGTTEEKFNENFSNSGSKYEAESRMNDLARYIYNLAFDWLVIKINEQLGLKAKSFVEKRVLNELKNLSAKNKKEKSEDLFEKCRKMYTISIVDFPGFRNYETLGGFCSNLAFECLNFYSSGTYMKLLASLAEEKVSFKFLEIPKSRFIVDFSLAKDFGLLPNLISPDFDRYWKAFKQTVSQEESDCRNIIQISSDSKFIMKYTWGETEYDINDLRNEACSSYSPQINYPFLVKCTNPIIASMLKFNEKREQFTGSYYNFADFLRKSLTYLLGPLGENQCFVIYCMKTPSSRLDYEECISLFRSTLVIPSLLWEWYGYPNWISKEKFISDISPSLNLDFEATHTFIESFLKKLLNHEDFIVSLRYLVLKNDDIAILNEYVNKHNHKDIASEMSFDISNNSIDGKRSVKSKSNKNNFEVNNLFGYSISGNTVDIVEPRMHDYLDSLYTVEEMSFERIELTDSFLDRKTKSNTSLQIKSKENIIKISSSKDFMSIAHYCTNFKRFDYRDCMHEIVTIQSIWRGIKTRKYFNALLILYRNARMIQKHWRGFICRKKINFLKLAIVLIQMKARKFFNKKVRAARRIQKWYRKILAQRQLELEIQNEIEQNLSKRSSLSTNSRTSTDKRNKSSEFANLNSEMIRKIVRSHTESAVHDDEVLFTPNILSTSRELARNHHIRQGSNNLPVEDRLRLQECNRQSKIAEIQRKQKEEEARQLTLSPHINKPRSYDKSFLERQALKQEEIRQKREMLALEKAAATEEHFTFTPTINKPKEKSTQNNTIDNLYIWAKIKENKMNKAREAQDAEVSKQMEVFRISEKNEKIIQQRNKRRQQSLSVVQAMENSLFAYWPSEKSNKS